MRVPVAQAGYLPNGLPYNRFGHGPRALVIVQGLVYDHRPIPGPLLPLATATYRFLEADYTVFLVNRRPGLPVGTTIAAMAAECAAAIRTLSGAPVDLLGVSTGGAIAQALAADHPELVRRLVLHSSAYRLGQAGRAAQRRAGQLARQGYWRASFAELLGLMLPSYGLRRLAVAPLIWLASLLGGLGLGAFRDPSDFAVAVEAEDRHDYKERLGAIVAPTLVVAGDQDPFYPAALLRETAAGIPHAQLILYPGMGHPATGAQFGLDVLAFLRATDGVESERPSIEAGTLAAQRAPEQVAHCCDVDAWQVAAAGAWRRYDG